DANFGVIADSQKLIVVGVEAADVELYNAAGMLVAKAEGQTVSVAGLKGLYIVKVKDVEGKLHAVKVAIK
ncbi:MAG: T9SS type A sorting domain-containing protein, partial [Bacteroidales bacterium]|nr:T9SS type A sorting domain-containing protein [Bacteroidales bacterium]